MRVQGALNRTVAEGAGGLRPLASGGRSEESQRVLGKLLVVQNSFRLPDSLGESFQIERVENVAAAVLSRRAEQSTPARMAHHRTLPATRPATDTTVATGGHWQVCRPVESVLPSAAESLSCISLSRLAPVLLSRIRSPSALSSDLEERASLRSLSTSSLSHSEATTPSRSSPERFLFFDSEEEEDYDGDNPVRNGTQNNRSPYAQQYRGIPHKGKGLREVVVGSVSGGGSSSDLEEGGTDNLQPFSGLKHRRLKVTKLRLYAKTTSPSVTTAISTEAPWKRSPLIVTIPLLSLPLASANIYTAIKHRKPTALSHFATKKRALSHSPPVGSTRDTSSFSIVGIPDGNVPVRALGKGGGKTGKQSKKNNTKSKAEKGPNQNTVVQDMPQKDTNAGARREPDLPIMADHRLETVPSISEDDQMSIASSNTTTTTTGSSGNSVGAGSRPRSHQTVQRGTRRTSRGVHSNSSLQRTNSNFSLESLFSYCPPTLTLRDGELAPEKSQSIKNLDRFSLPSSHPIGSWSLGQPVRGRWTGIAAPPKSKRPRKMTNQSSKI